MRLHVGAAVEALRMALVLAVHLVCTLCHTTTLAVLPRTRREVGRPTAMDRLRVEDMIRGVSLPLSTPLRAAAVALVCSTPVRVRAPHATMQARIGHDAQLAAPSLAIRSNNHHSRQHRTEQRTALRLTAQASMQTVTEHPRRDVVVALTVRAIRELREPKLLPKRVAHSRPRLPAAWNPLTRQRSHRWALAPQVGGEHLWELLRRESILWRRPRANPR
mmetsp:Transcript_73711/g.221603  ORF Transcript_73711/g.221603 Transcript_73711/m.221603 type:complete len:219 (+) Transcript_73711:295-951(+)